MDQTAVQAAKDCLQRAEAAATRMDVAESFASLEQAWTDFLIMANRVYTKLEQGAKGYPQSFGWFGLKKHERRKDPLLKYVKNARDADEHGLNPVTEREGPTKLTSYGAGIEVLDGDTIRINPEAMNDPPKITMGWSPERVRLVQVITYGDKYDPPDLNPLRTAQKMLEHLKALVDEADKLSGAQVP